VQARSIGLKVVPWTVNEPADMARLIGLGVDGIISDYPNRLRAVMAAKGMALPPLHSSALKRKTGSHASRTCGLSCACSFRKTGSHFFGTCAKLARAV
jgi:hypothetical protein